MPLETINNGLSPDDSNADTLRESFRKVNSNFNDLFRSKIDEEARDDVQSSEFFTRKLLSHSIIAIGLRRKTQYEIELDQVCDFVIYNDALGYKFTIDITQGPNGSGTVRNWGGMDFGSAGRPTLQTVGGAVDRIRGEVTANGKITAVHEVVRSEPSINNDPNLLYALVPSNESTLTKVGNNVTEMRGEAGSAMDEAIIGTGTYIEDASTSRGIDENDRVPNFPTVELDGIADEFVGGIIYPEPADRFPITTYFLARLLTPEFGGTLMGGCSGFDMRFFSGSSASFRMHVWNGITTNTSTPLLEGGWQLVCAVFTGGTGGESYQLSTREEFPVSSFGNRTSTFRGLALGRHPNDPRFMHLQVGGVWIFDDAHDQTKKDLVMSEILERFNFNGQNMSNATRVEPERTLRRKPPVFLVAHRGGGNLFEYPENTEASWEAGAKYRPYACEVDTNVSSDGVAFLYHDVDNLKLLSDVETVFPDRQNDPPNTFTWDELQQLDVGSHRAGFAGEKIPSLESFLRFCKREGIIPFLDLKNSSDAALVSIEKACDRSGVPLASCMGLFDWTSFTAKRNFVGRLLYATAATSQSWVVDPTTATAGNVRGMLENGVDLVFTFRAIGLDQGNLGDHDTFHENGLAAGASLVSQVAEAEASIAAGFEMAFTDRLQNFKNSEYVKPPAI